MYQDQVYPGIGPTDSRPWRVHKCTGPKSLNRNVNNVGAAERETGAYIANEERVLLGQLLLVRLAHLLVEMLLSWASRHHLAGASDLVPLGC